AVQGESEVARDARTICRRRRGSMRHLKLEAIARLVDEPPTPEEAAHLESCDRCATIFSEMSAQTARLGDLADPQMPLPLRRHIADVLAAEPLPVPSSGAIAPSRWLRAAAAIAIFTVGAATGAGLAR